MSSLHKNDANLHIGAKSTKLHLVILFFSPTWCENIKTKMNNMLLLALGDFDGKY
jgi:hypothetical protein